MMKTFFVLQFFTAFHGVTLEPITMFFPTREECEVFGQETVRAEVKEFLQPSSGYGTHAFACIEAQGITVK